MARFFDLLPMAGVSPAIDFNAVTFVVPYTKSTYQSCLVWQDFFAPAGVSFGNMVARPDEHRSDGCHSLVLL